MMAKRLIKILLSSFICIMLITGFPVWADESESEGNPGINISEEILPLKKGTEYQLHCSYDDSESGTITWHSSAPEIADVSQSGLVTAYETGQTVIYAEYDNGIVVSDSCTVNVKTAVNKNWAKRDGNWYLFTGNAALSGWQSVNSIWYYFDSEGVMQTGWLKYNNKWYYLNSDGAMQAGWLKVDDEWYFLNSSGEMLTGWLKYKNRWYYLQPGSGIMQTDWQQISGKWYYLDPSNDGVMATGWLKVGDYWYYLQPGTGIMQTGWQKINGNWYLLADAPSGRMLEGWQKKNGSWYYLQPVTGVLLTGWQQIDEKWYLLADAPSGRMLSGWQLVKGYWYYLQPGTGIMQTGWLNYDSAWYYLKKSGAMATETVSVDGRQEVFHTNGKWISTTSMDTKAANYTSTTNYLILVSLTDKVTKIYRKSGSSWNVEKAFLCTVGDPTKGWDTIKGEFYIGQSSWGNPTWKGYSFEDTDGHTLYYWTRFCDSFLFHSVMYDRGTWNLTPYSNELGKALSHGCVRLRVENAKWIYDNIPYGTKVVVY